MAAAQVGYKNEVTASAQALHDNVTANHQELYVALASGGLDPDVDSTVHTRQLSDAIEQGRALSTNSVEGRVLLEKAEVILQLRTAVAASKWEDVQVALQKAGTLEIARPEVQAARDKLQQRKKVIDVAVKLRQAMEAADAELLRTYLQDAYRCEVSAGQELFDTIYQAQV